jgi:UTP-glucose-1-phosphate uridylyltransferase
MAFLCLLVTMVILQIPALIASSTEPLIGVDAFAVILPDDLCTSDSDSVLLQMIKLYEQNPDCCIVAIEEVAASEVDKYGVIDGELLEGSNNAYRVHNMVVKHEKNIIFMHVSVTKNGFFRIKHVLYINSLSM